MDGSAVTSPGHPVFERPPVAEVTLSVQFDPLDALHAAHIGRIWDRWADSYPRHEEHDELGPMPDEVTAVPLEAGVVFKITDSTPLPRTWFLDGVGEHIVQVQRDRLVLNWRRQDNGGYPHYTELLPQFRTVFETFEGFASEHDLGRVMPNQCQVTYLNPIPLDGELGCPDGLPGLLEGWSGATSEPPSLGGGEASVRIRYPLIAEDEVLLGRLFVNAGTAIASDTNEPVLLMEMTARGRPIGDGLEGVVRFLDIGHDAIVTMFAALTTKTMQTRWGRQP